MRKMPSPLYNAMGGEQKEPMLNNFGRFMYQMRGNDPNQMINEYVQSGQLSQKQLDMVQTEYQKIKGRFDGMRKMFGF